MHSHTYIYKHSSPVIKLRMRLITHTCAFLISEIKLATDQLSLGETANTFNTKEQSKEPLVAFLNASAPGQPRSSSFKEIEDPVNCFNFINLSDLNSQYFYNTITTLDKPEEKRPLNSILKPAVKVNPRNRKNGL